MLKQGKPVGGVSSSARAKLLRVHAERFHEWGMTSLLVLLILNVFVLPVVVPLGARSVIRDLVVTITLIAGVLAVARRSVTTYILVPFCAASVVVRWMEWFVSGNLLASLRGTATLLALVPLSVAVGMRVFAAGRVTLDRVMGAVALYLLMGLAFAIAYEDVARQVPGAFNGATGDVNDLANWGYFSFVTLTTLGYGDITPVATIARSLATFEAFIGQLYPAVILARLVSLQLVPPPTDS